MKLKSILFTFSIGLLALVLSIVFSAPAPAQKTTAVQKPPDSKVAEKSTVDDDEAGERASNADKSETSDAKTDKASVQDKPSAEKKAAASKKDADYWFNKGALCATYGNDRAAIKYFQKAISLDPNRSGAYFEQGISYAQLAKFDQALLLINKALEMQPQNGMFLYGRGRVHLMAGDKEKAMEDFKRAAELDDEDAQHYLEYIAQLQE
jgi:tetratricopeptide (TPR) repeat protein